VSYLREDDWVYTVMTNDVRLYGKVLFSGSLSFDVFWQNRLLSHHSTDNMRITILKAEHISEQEKLDLNTAIRDWCELDIE
jgi:hypothetical protein